jgi:hypothetical protein
VPPLLGYNNNVRYLGRTFHIQTEDSGTKYARIMTHLFIDGGHIVKTTRTEYGAVVGQPDMPETVRRMMKEQHKNMFLALRAGEFDALIDRIVNGGTSIPATEPALSRVPRLRADSLPSLSFNAGEEAKTTPGLPTLVIESPVAPEFSMTPPSVPNPEMPASNADDNSKRVSTRMRKAKSVAPPPERRSSAREKLASESQIARHSTRERVANGAVAVAPSADSGALDASLSNSVGVGDDEQDRPSERPLRATAARPATTTVDAIDPRSQNIFGEATAGRQTLDDVILSFLEDEEK